MEPIGQVAAAVTAIATALGALIAYLHARQARTDKPASPDGVDRGAPSSPASPPNPKATQPPETGGGRPTRPWYVRDNGIREPRDDRANRRPQPGATSHRGPNDWNASPPPTVGPPVGTPRRWWLDENTPAGRRDRERQARQ